MDADFLRSAIERLRDVEGAPLPVAPRPSMDPVHTLYVGADRFDRELVARWGGTALEAMDAYGGEPAGWLARLGLEGSPDLSTRVHERVRERLARAPVADLRLDFEDGYGERTDAVEDADARRAAEELAASGLVCATPGAGLGLRIKAFTPELVARGLRTLELFVETLVARDAFPARLAVCLPKVTQPVQVALLADVLDELEARLGLPAGGCVVEFMVEATATLFDAEGRLLLPALARAARGRATGAHLGTYDYTASAGVPATHQRLDHPACDAARRFMQIAFAGSGLTLSDGADNVLPVEPHPFLTRPAPERTPVADARWAENRDAVVAAWRRHAGHVTRALTEGLHQGWDLHALQLPSRWTASFAFFAGARDDAVARLAKLLRSAEATTQAGAVMDDAATGQALLELLRRGWRCGALDAADLRAAGLLDELDAVKRYVDLARAHRAPAG